MRFFTIVRTFMLFLGITLSVFSMIEHQNLLLVFAYISKNTSWRWSDHTEIYKYNESLLLAQSGNFLEAKSLLSPLINNPGIVPSDRIFELYGDILYSLSGSKDDVILLYKKSLTSAQNLRVEKKISLLVGTSSWKISENSGTWQDSAFSSWSKTVSGEDMRESTKMELQRIQKQRKGLVNQDTIQSQDVKTKTQEVFQLLEWGEIKMDW